MANFKQCLLAQDAILLPPSNDRIFKVLLTHPDAKQVLMDIISAVIGKKVTDATIRNVELPVSDIDEKEQRFDVNCTIENGDQIDVEMHSTPVYETGLKRRNFLKKYTYFLTDLHSSQKSKGVEYHNLVRTYQITFTSHTVFRKKPDFFNRFSLRNEKGAELTDQINLIIIELSKLKNILAKPINQLTSFEKWLLFLRFAPTLELRSKINDIIREKKEIAMAATILQEISQNEDEKALFRSQKMAEMDNYSNMKTCERIGEMRSDKKWKGVVAEQKAVIASQNVKLADMSAEIARLQTELKKH
ncbi:MAG: Rpn family recombination-promoting nuclease/putative transposase [Treponema sp.]|nr:Rpn family recombination-promoting nuclease/putative transposase [Treponema sp.]